jgi:hypothetical protein
MVTAAAAGDANVLLLICNQSMYTSTPKFLKEDTISYSKTKFLYPTSFLERLVLSECEYAFTMQKPNE